MKIVFVCTGNICRSPMAEALLRARLEERGCAGVDVTSAGTWADPDQPLMDGAAEVLRARGIMGNGHRSQRVTPELLADADLVVAMTSVHRREVLELAPDVADKVVLMKELAEIDVSADAGLAGLVGARRPPWRRGLDLDDPYGLGSSAYDRAAREIDAGVEVLARLLCP